MRSFYQHSLLVDKKARKLYATALIGLFCKYFYVLCNEPVFWL